MNPCSPACLSTTPSWGVATAKCLTPCSYRWRATGTLPCPHALAFSTAIISETTKLFKPIVDVAWLPVGFACSRVLLWETKFCSMGFYMFFCICFVSFHPGWDIPDVSLLYFLLKRNIGSCLQVLSCNIEVFSLNYCLFIGLSYFCSDYKHAFRLTGLTKYAINVSDLTSKTITQAIFFLEK